MRTKKGRSPAKGQPATIYTQARAYCVYNIIYIYIGRGDHERSNKIHEATKKERQPTGEGADALKKRIAKHDAIIIAEKPGRIKPARRFEKKLKKFTKPLDM